MAEGRLVRIDDTSLHVVTRGDGPLPLLVLHGGPGLDHHEFADYLDPLGDRCTLHLVDQRGQGRSARDSEPHTWTLERMAQDVAMLALALGLARYAVLGHSYGAFVTLQHAVDYPGHAAASIVGSGIPSARFMGSGEEAVASLPDGVRERVLASLEREPDVRTPEDLASILDDQWPFHFADPLDPRIDDYRARVAGTVFSPEVLAAVAGAGYTIDLEDRLGEVSNPTLVLVGRHDRVCPVAGSEAIAAGVPGAELVVFERSGHMTFVEEQDAFLAAVRDFLDRRVG